MTKTRKTRTQQVEREGIVNDAPKLHEVFDIGQASHQGDLIFVRIDKLPASAKPRTNRQLAEGDTQGSRHVVEHGDIFDCDRREVSLMIEKATAKYCHRPVGVYISEQYIGPVFVSPDAPTADDVTHPEHGNQGFPAGSICATVFQRNLDAEEREAVARD